MGTLFGQDNPLGWVKARDAGRCLVPTSIDSDEWETMKALIGPGKARLH